jgi:hypothetical protein
MEVCSRELEDLTLDLNEQECERFGKSRLTNTAGECSQSISPMHTSLETSENAADCAIRPTISPASGRTTFSRLMSLRAAFRARTSASQTTPEADWLVRVQDFGQNTHESLASYDRDTQSWRTSQHCLFPSEMPTALSSSPHQSAEFLETWPTSGMTLNGIAYRRPDLVLTMCAREFSSSPIVPTPAACDHKGAGRPRKNRGPGNNLRDWFRQNYGFLYPPVRAVEYLMGYPIGYTDLNP